MNLSTRLSSRVGAWLAEFNAQWPDGSPAALNYRDRILAGPAWTIAEAQT